MTKVLHSKRVVSSVYSKSGKKEDFAERNSSIDLSLQRHALTEFFHNRYSFKDFTKFTGKHLYHILYLIKLQLSSLPLYSVPSAGVFLWTLWILKNNFRTHRTLPGTTSDSSSTWKADKNVPRYCNKYVKVVISIPRA